MEKDPRVRAAGDLEELLDVLVGRLTQTISGPWPLAPVPRSELRAFLQRAYGFGYDAAQGDAEDGAFGSVG